MRVFILLLVLLFSINCFAWDEEIISFPTFTANEMDTHMLWDDTHLWIPESEFSLCETPSPIVSSSNLIRYNPATDEKISCDLGIDDNTGPVVYEVVQSLIDTDIVYVSGPYYGHPSVYSVSKSTFQSGIVANEDDWVNSVDYVIGDYVDNVVATVNRVYIALTNHGVSDTPVEPGVDAGWETTWALHLERSVCSATQITDVLMWGGSGAIGSKMAISLNDTVEYIWMGAGWTGILSRLTTWNQAVDDWDFSAIDKWYGMATVQLTTTLAKVYAAGFIGNLLIFPSDLDNTTSDRIQTIDFRADLVADAVLTSMIYDGTYIWIAISSDSRDEYGFIKYTPITAFDDVGEWVVYWLNAPLSGSIVTMLDFDNRIWTTNEEHPVDCVYDNTVSGSPVLIGLDKTTYKSATIPLHLMKSLHRIVPGIGRDNESIYVGGYGADAIGLVLNLDKVTIGSVWTGVTFDNATIDNATID